MKLRDGNIEVLRLVSMFLICMIHAVGYVDARWCHWLSNVSFVGVLVFVLISGFYGMRFAVAKVLKLEGVAVGCAFAVIVMASVSDGLGFSTCLPSFGMAWWLEVLAVFKGYWFVHAYVVMMCIAPFVEYVFADTLALSSERRSILLSTCMPFLMMVFGWSFAMMIPCVQNLIPRTEGLVPFSGITLFATYLVGRLYRVFDWDNLFKGRWLLPVAVICGGVSSLWYGFARYNSPFLLVFAVGIFWAFRRLRVQDGCVAALTWLTPSVLPVYLLHCNPYGYRMLGFLEERIRSCLDWDYAVFFILAAVVFVSGFFFDIPRRIIARGLQRVIR